LLKKQRMLYAKFRRSHLERDRRIYLKAQQDAKALNENLFNNFISESLNDGDYSKSFWKFIRSKKNEYGTPPLRDSDGILQNEPYKKAEILNNQFKSVFNSVEESTVRQDVQDVDCPDMPEIVIS